VEERPGDVSQPPSRRRGIRKATSDTTAAPTAYFAGWAGSALPPTVSMTTPSVHISARPAAIHAIHRGLNPRAAPRALRDDRLRWRRLTPRIQPPVVRRVRLLLRGLPLDLLLPPHRARGLLGRDLHVPRAPRRHRLTTERVQLGHGDRPSGRVMPTAPHASVLRRPASLAEYRGDRGSSRTRPCTVAGCDRLARAKGPGP
jgi:hypothetical protein